MRIEHDEECRDCGGTGLYVGPVERDGNAVVCHRCKGTGCFRFVHEYTPFVARRKRNDIAWVVEANPGIVVGLGNNLRLPEFGGMPYAGWSAGKPFPRGSEMRKFVCPAWWCQSCGKDKPDWAECGLGRFSDCKYFPTKDKCWTRYDWERP